MNNLQYLLTKLAEEANEVGQMALKCQHFGIEHEWKGEVNIDRLFGEINDLLGVLRLLHMEEGILFIPDETQVEAKVEKLKKYREISRLLGLVDPE